MANTRSAKHRKSRGPQRLKSSSTSKASALVAELERRELADIDTCREAWENDHNPRAVCQAMLELHDCPEWLRDAVLLLAAWPEDVRKLWKRASKDTVDATRASLSAQARLHHFEWETAHSLANEQAARIYGDLPRVSVAAMKKSYGRVQKSLTKERWKYYRAKPGLQKRIALALDRRIDLLQTKLKEQQTE